MFRRIVRYLLISLAVVVALLLLFVLVSVVTIDDTSYQERSGYTQMQKNLAQLKKEKIPPAVHGMEAGYAKVNITPSSSTSLAGSGLRKLAYDSVHDSIFVRTMVISNGTEKVALVSADMLIIPPTVVQVLEEKLLATDFTRDNVYLSATHTHSSLGNWGERLAGRLYAGPYSDSLVQFLAEKFVASIVQANAGLVEATLLYGTIPAGEVLYNRLADEKGTIDSLLRVLEVHRVDGKKLVLASYTGHATCARSDNEALSRDYPGVLVDNLEEADYTFAMFMAGAVGSHGCKGAPRGWERVNFIGDYLTETLLAHRASFRTIHDSTLAMFRVPLPLGEPQLKIAAHWRIRPWLFRAAFGEYPASLTALRIGDLVMLGTPCDFSGELTPPIDSAASLHGLEAMVTSFNGNYIGYITLDKHYDIDHYETRVMSWYGPGNGAYLSESLIQILEAIDQ